MAEFYDRRIHSEDNLKKLQDAGHLTPETVEKIKASGAAFLDQATGAASAAAKTSRLDERRGEYEMGQTDLQNKINEDMTREPGWFTSRLTPEQAKAKYAKDAEHLATIKAEIDAEDAKLNPPQPMAMSPDGQAVAQPTALGGMQAQQGVPMTNLGPQGGDQGAMSVDQAAAPYTQGIDIAQQGVAMQMGAAAAKAKEEAALYGNMAKDMQKNQAELDAMRQKKSEWVDSQTKVLDDEQRAVSEMRVDPDRYWNNLSTMQKIMGSLAVATGRASGDKNAGNVIANAIERDVEAQKIAIGQKQKGVDGRINSYERFKDKFKDDELAKLASMDTGLKVAQLKIQQVAAKTGSADTQGKLMTVMGELEQKRAAIRMEIGTKMASMYGAADGVNPEAMDKDKRERYVPGFGLALSKEDATGMKTYLGEVGAAKQTINRLLEINNSSNKSMTPSLRAEADSLRLQLQGALRTQILGPGTISDSDRKLLDNVIVDPTTMFSLDKNTQTRLKAILQQIDRTIASKANALGLKTVGQRVGFNSASK